MDDDLVSRNLAQFEETRQRVFDAKAFREARPEIAQEYEVQRPGNRRFLLKV